MSQNASPDGPATEFSAVRAELLRKAFQVSEPATQLVHSEDGFRLVKTFLRIGSQERREAVLKYVTDMAMTDGAEGTLQTSGSAL